MADQAFGAVVKVGCNFFTYWCGAHLTACMQVENAVYFRHSDPNLILTTVVDQGLQEEDNIHQQDYPTMRIRDCEYFL